MQIAKNRLLVWFFAFFLLVSDGHSIMLSEDEANAFASFIKSLVDTTSGTNNGAICSFGNDEVTRALTKSVHSSKSISTMSESKNCKALYVAKDKEKGLRAEIDKIVKKDIMTLAIFENFTESGGMILIEMGRRNFELTVNPQVMKDSGLRLSPLAINLVIN